MPNLSTELTALVARRQPFAFVRIPRTEHPFVIFDGPLLDSSLPPADGPYFRIASWDGGEKGFRSVTREEYLASLSELLACIGPELPKVVFSRTIEGQLNLSTLAAKALRFFDSFPDALGFLYYTEETGFWLGASPELLLTDDGAGNLSTMSLAGTRPAGTPGPWDEKNVREHECVTDFIVERLRSAGARNIKVYPTDTLQYGPVEHLYTPITALASPDDYGEIVDSLSPTPALCGFPREAARQAIARYERHSRGCYGGYLDFRLPGSTVRCAYVNLRCARISVDGRWTAFAGGGIVEGSVPEAEWDETVRKASRIVEILSEDE